jgi:hypothetical protein
MASCTFRLDHTMTFTAYDHLYTYAGSRGRERFTLQNVVDAHHAQTATDQTKPIALIMALVGLYLHVEKGFSGLQVQHAHMHLGRNKHQWPGIVLPQTRGAMTENDLMQVPEGDARDAAISEWCRSVWDAYAENRIAIIDLLQRHHVIERSRHAAEHRIRISRCGPEKCVAAVRGCRRGSLPSARC